MSNIKLPQWILESIARGEAVLFLGAGASFGASGKKGEKPLNGDQLRDVLADKYLGGYRKKKPLADVAEHAKNISTIGDVQSYVFELFEPLEPAEFHKLIPSFRWHAIFTTNYDFIVERSYLANQAKLQNIGRLVRDDDKFSDVISALDSVPFCNYSALYAV